jgi:hypothetical protein
MSKSKYFQDPHFESPNLTKVGQIGLSLLERMQVVVDIIQSCETIEMRIENDILLQTNMCDGPFVMVINKDLWNLSEHKCGSLRGRILGRAQTRSHRENTNVLQRTRAIIKASR